MASPILEKNKRGIAFKNEPISPPNKINILNSVPGTIPNPKANVTKVPKQK